MTLSLIIAATLVAAACSLFFSTLTYSLRDFSRARLSDYLDRANKSDYLPPTLDHASDLIFVTAFCRLFANILVLIGVLRLFHDSHLGLGLQYLFAVLVTGLVTLFVSVAIPHAISRHTGELFISMFVELLHGLRAVLLPAVKVMHLTDALVRRATARGDSEETADKIEEEIEQDILSAVEEGEKEGVVDEEERQMIESVIEFHDTQVGQIMTPRPAIFSVDVHATLEGVKAKIAESGHSRIPVCEGTLDHVVGILYARDLIRLLGNGNGRDFNLRQLMRPPFYVPETKPLRDLLRDFRLQKVHIAIVMDEYGGTSGLVTIEDIFEELVGDISDEHEPIEPAMLVRHDEHTAEADARIYIGDLNRNLGLSLSEDAGYDTLGGFVSTTLGRIPERGTTFEHDSARYTILEAEPQRVNRVRIEIMQPAAGGDGEAEGSD